MANDISYIKKQLDHIDNQVSSNYVSKEEFKPVQRLVYGMVAIILAAVVGAILTVVLNR